MKKLFAFLVGALLLGALMTVAFVPAALAHAEIESCTPAIDSTVETAPDKVVCTTSQGMKAEGSKLSVFDAAGAQVDKGDSAVDLTNADRTTIAVSLDVAKVVDGVYTVKWTTLSADDNDEASGEFKFTVGHAMDLTGTATPAATEAGPEVTHPNDDHSIGVVTLDGKEVTLKITAPTDDQSFPAGDVKVGATVEGVTLGENGYHLHFYVDDKLQAMGEGAQNTYTATITEPGAHEVMVVLADAAHENLNNAHVHVNIEAANAQATTVATAASTVAAATPAAQATAVTAATVVPTEMPSSPTVEATAITAPEATAAPTVTAELPTAGEGTNYALFGLLLVVGVIVLGAGALVLTRTRR